MLVGAQFPYSPIWDMIDEVKATSTTRLHSKIFTKNTIHPNIVTAIYVLLKQDKNSLLSLPIWEQLYTLRVLCILVPKKKYNQIGFGELKVLGDEGDDDENGDGKKRKKRQSNMGEEENENDEEVLEVRRDKKKESARNSNKKTVLGTSTSVTEDYGGEGLGVGLQSKLKMKRPLKKLTAKGNK